MPACAYCADPSPSDRVAYASFVLALSGAVIGRVKKWVVGIYSWLFVTPANKWEGYNFEFRILPCWVSSFSIYRFDYKCCERCMRTSFLGSPTFPSC